MKKFHVMFHTDTNHATQFITVEAENKGDAKSIVRGEILGAGVFHKRH